MVSNDGGTSWGHAITGEGINANYLCAGSIDAGTINIRAGEGIPFTWDAKGISAYASAYKDANGEIKDWEKFDTSTFVRFDQFGVYGVKKDGQFRPTNNNQIDINNPSTPFGLTWNGFFFRTGEIGNGVTIDSENDLCVVNNKKRRVKIGKIGSEYGIAIYNDDEKPVISQDSSGKLKVVGDITATNLTIDDQALIKGHIEATIGKIGEWSIGEVNSLMTLSGCLYYDQSSGGVGKDYTMYMIPKSYTSGVDIAGSTGITGLMLTVGSGFGVTSTGKMYAKDADVSGNIKATTGKIGGWTIGNEGYGVSAIGVKDSLYYDPLY